MTQQTEPADHFVDVISNGALCAERISFRRMRSTAMANYGYGMWKQLGRGRAILGSVEELDQYLWSYGRMILNQWEHILPKIELPKSKLDLFDYGCGQGTASLLVKDHNQGLKNQIEQITLIEPSRVALTRAEKTLACAFPNATVKGINKTLDNIEKSDLMSTDSTAKLHLFSNILDVEGFDEHVLLEKVTSQPGEHFIIAASNQRSVSGGSRMPELFKSLNKKHDNGTIQVHEAKDWVFTDNGGLHPMTSYAFYLKLETK